MLRFLLKKLPGLIFFGCLLLLLAGGYVYKVTRNLPSVDKIVREGVNPSQYTQIFAANGTPIMSHGKFHHTTVPVKDVSPHFIDALLATEDRRFYQHPGVDPLAIGRAVVQDVTHRQLREGGSTLTQQLARNVFLSNERSIERKIREMALSFQLEQKLSKDEILELYINNIYFGEGAYGIAAASEIYFGKKPSRLSVEEAALLAGMPQAPSVYSPFDNMEAAKKRRNEVLGNLKEVGKLNNDELKAAQERGIRVNPAGRSLASSDRAPYFNRYVISQIKEYLDLDEQSFWQSGFKVYTTLDLNAQAIGEQTVREQSKAWGRTGKNQQASLTAINPGTGAILAYVGGKNYAESQFDRVSKAVRSPGSLFKVFTYTTAIDRGYDPQRVYMDEPIEIDGWRPTNYDKQHHGYMTLARALALSNNVIAVKVLNEIGPPAVVDVAQRMGIRSSLNPYLALTLGGSSVNLLEITSAFGVLANQGVRAEPYAIERILDARQRVVYQYAPMKSDVLSRGTVDTMVKMLMGVVQRGTGKAADIGKPMAGKTGTSDDYRDAWFIGFTPNLVAGVWVGNDDNSPMKGMTGGALPARIWRTFMQRYTAGKLVANFDLPYSKPLAESDFVTYDLNNLSQQENSNPVEFDASGLPVGETTEGAQEGLPGGEHLAEPAQQNPAGGPLVPGRSQEPVLETGAGSPSHSSSGPYRNNPNTLPVAPLAGGGRHAPVSPPTPVQLPSSSGSANSAYRPLDTRRPGGPATGVIQINPDGTEQEVR